MAKDRALFVCVHNSARSQMAAAFLNQLAGERFEAESAGLEPGVLNSLVVDAMKLINIDISQNKTQSVFDVYKSNRLFAYVITVCDEASGERCPIFPGVTKRLHWSFPDPSKLQGSYEDKLKQTVAIRDQIKTRIEEWIRELAPSLKK
jgi:arsenate reductase (thioredoxin)